ncbi:MAG: hypothetical protein CLLPBCKN_005631 [Chroococcidiopsis cubana SAG 39.79]|nr:hypothetical protein [Chroococcidiopsis cubana SAG 39.79]
MIEHQRNGYLAQAYKTEDLAQGIAWVLVNLERHSKLCKIAREKQSANLRQQSKHNAIRLFSLK